jgi:hypothetical protein
VTIKTIINYGKIRIISSLEAKPGKEEEAKCAALVLEEPGTVNWYGWQIGSSTLESLILKLKKEKAHLAGKIVEALMANAELY